MKTFTWQEFIAAIEFADFAMGKKHSLFSVRLTGEGLDLEDIYTKQLYTIQKEDNEAVTFVESSIYTLVDDDGESLDFEFYRMIPLHQVPE
jgi:hypothetical protein